MWGRKGTILKSSYRIFTVNALDVKQGYIVGFGESDQLKKTSRSGFETAFNGGKVGHAAACHCADGLFSSECLNYVNSGCTGGGYYERYHRGEQQHQC